MWDPDSITPTHINDLRAAAESSWGDDVRHESFIGHPDPSAGCCYVTARWLQKRLGGHVGTKNGHFFWVSPDKKYIIDLTGDLFTRPPDNPAHDGKLLDENDEPWAMDPHQKTHRPGPAMYKRADHPIWKGFRVLPDSPDHERGNQFARRADAHMAGQHVSSFKHSDLIGADPYPGSTPQKEEEWDQGAPMGMPMTHDEPDYVPDDSNGEYTFVFVNGQLHVSPAHSHQELAAHAGITSEDHGPTAVGYAEVRHGHVMWSVESNIGLRTVADILKEYSQTVGWEWDGMTDSNGQMASEDFGAKKSMWYKVRKDGHMIMAEKPLPHGKRINIEGKTARVHPEVGPAREAIIEWAGDFGYKLAEYPGGGNFEDKMKVRPNLDLYNRGDQDATPEKHDMDLSMTGTFKCGKCHQRFDTIEALRLHSKDHDQLDSEPISDGKFPWPQGFDAPLGFGTVPIPNGGNTIAKVAYMPVPSYKAIRRFSRYAHYAGLYEFETNPGLQFYGAYAKGQLVGYAAVAQDGEIVRVDSMHIAVTQGLVELIQLHRGSIYAHAHSEAAAGVLRRLGMVNVAERRFAAPGKGDMPKDMIENAIPIVYDVKQHDIHIGYAGERTHEVQHRGGGRFTPGGIIEGYYEPGGKVILIAASNVGWTVRQFADLWYHRFPQMEITSVELETPDGETRKLASGNVGQYIKTLVQSDQAATNAYQALKYVGGKVYVVGGAVRDSLMGKTPKDIDMMVAGIPAEQVDHVLSQLPGRVDLTGKRFGVYRYRINGQEVEIALPRQDKYETSRRGEGVITVDHTLPIEKDLERRDFTANSMAVDLDSGQLIDPYEGAKDIEGGLLRTTHPDSFREDPTRLVRALNAHSRFGLNPDERTRHEMETNGHLLRGESPDALNKILDKLFASHNPASAIRLAHDTGILEHLFPEVEKAWEHDQNNPHHMYKLGEHLLHVLDNVSKLTTDPDVRLAALLHDVGKPESEWRDPVTGYSHYYRGQNGEGANHEDVGARMVEERMRALNYPVSRIKRTQHIVQQHMFPAFSTGRGARKFLQRVGDQHADDLLNIREADQTGKGQTPEEMAARTSADQMRQLVDESRKQQAPTDLSNLAINGNDLVAMGVQPGPQIGNILRSLLDDVVQTPTDNNRDRLLQLAQGYVAAQPA